jgi:HK97 family phage major capsid protein
VDKYLEELKEIKERSEAIKEELKSIEDKKVEMRSEANAEGITVERIDELTKEADELNERSKELNAELTELEARSEAIKEEKSKIKVEKEIRQMTTTKTDVELRAESLMNTGTMEMRAILSTGQIATPTAVGGVNGLAEIGVGIVDDVKAVALTGNGAYKVAYKATNAAAAAVTDGQAISSTEPTFGVVTINPAEWGTLDTISNQVKKVSPLSYEAEVEASALIALREYASGKIIEAVQASDLAGEITQAIDKDYLTGLLLSYTSIAGKGEVVLYLNQTDLKALGAVRGTNEKRRLFDITFDPGTTKSGIISENGMACKFRVIDKLATGTQLFGQPKTIEMPMWDGYQIDTDEGGKYFEANMIAVRGLQTANADLCAKHGMYVVSNS